MFTILKKKSEFEGMADVDIIKSLKTCSSKKKVLNNNEDNSITKEYLSNMYRLYPQFYIFNSSYVKQQLDILNMNYSRTVFLIFCGSICIQMTLNFLYRRLIYTMIL